MWLFTWNNPNRRYEDSTNRVCRLRKSLYGLKQASKILVEIGFVQCTHDAGVYWRSLEKRVVFLTVYVDDIVLAGISADTEEVIKQLALHFKLKHLGRVRHLLGMEINYLSGCMLCLSQKAYIERLAEKYGLSTAKPYLVACTRPNLANAVRTLERYMSAYTAEN
ncbi:hypothetical protein PHMEG_00019547 [Phytophthora megakarya]|uniref:Reverse transcriptase Ty1/copia-type domain-containing protein n=1 Tax=Phytophthora megakarya TaxID=4795 RepID=A0A225VRN8_9STRA|nr:hypothetical protein PHMEG_00019547 [Phytophthora megakarya]